MRQKTLLAVVVAIAAVGTAACSSTRSTASPSVTAGATGTTAAPKPVGGTPGGAGSAGTESVQLQSLVSSVQAAKKGTFKATFQATGSGAPASSITVEQKPPKTLFSAGSSGLMLSTGTATYLCSGATGGLTCLSANGANPLASLLDLYTGTTALTLFQQWQSQISTHVAGLSVTFTNQSFAGQPSRCANWSYQGQSAKYCVTDSGILSYVGGTSATGGGSFQLTDYSTNVPDSDFNLPAGATVETLPTDTSVP
jgi:hypothetical protein